MLMHGYQSILRPFVCLSVHLPVLSCFSANCLSSFRPPGVRLSTYCPSPFRSANYPSVCLSIYLLALVFPPTVCHRFDHQLPLCLSLCPLDFSQRPLTVRHRFDRRLPIYLSAHLPVLSCFSRHPPSTRHRLERQHAQRNRRPGAVDWTDRTELAVCYYCLVSHTPPSHIPPPIFAIDTL